MIIVDTGPLVAAAVAKDVNHRRCVELFASLRLNNERLDVTLDRRHFSVVRPQHVDAFELLP